MVSFNGVSIGKISNVRCYVNDTNTFYADVELSVAPGFPAETTLFVASAADHALTGKYVLECIRANNYEGTLTIVDLDTDIVSGEKFSNLQISQPGQPTQIGADPL